MSTSIYNVFTPSTPALLTFVERRSINTKLERALNTPGKQVILYGHTGSGKTTTINHKISSIFPKVITTRCAKGMTMDDLILDAFDQLDVFSKELETEEKSAKLAGSFEAKFLSLKATLSTEIADKSQEQRRRIVSRQLTPSTLAKLIGSLGGCWVIEDFHKVISDDKERLSQIMKVFMDTAVEYPSLKMVTIGAVNTAREVIQYDKEMKNRVAEIKVPLMSDDYLRQIIQLGEQSLNISFDENVKQKIVNLSCGLPAVTHNLCLLVCQQKGIKKRESTSVTIQGHDLKDAIKEFIFETEDSYESVFEKATLCKYQRQHEHPRELLYALIDTGEEEVTIADISQILKAKHPGYKSTNLKVHVDELTGPDREEVLRYHAGSNTYHFSNPFFKAYVSAKRYEESQKTTLSKNELLDQMNVFIDDLKLGKLQFLKDFQEFEEEYTDTLEDDHI